MRLPFWSTLLFLPALCHAQVQLSNTVSLAPSGTERVMSIQPTQTVRYGGDLNQLHDRLQLTDAQQPAWTGYSDSVKAYSALFFSETPLSAHQTESAPQQVERIATKLQNRLDSIREIERKTQTLYAVLNPQQQKTADQQLMASIPVFGNSPGAR